MWPPHTLQTADNCPALTPCLQSILSCFQLGFDEHSTSHACHTIGLTGQVQLACLSCAAILCGLLLCHSSILWPRAIPPLRRHLCRHGR